VKALTVGCSSWCWGGLFLADASSQEPLGPGWGRVSPEKAGGGAGSVAGRGAGRRRRSPQEEGEESFPKSQVGAFSLELEEEEGAERRALGLWQRKQVLVR